MLRLSPTRCLLLTATLLSVLIPGGVRAQDDPNEVPLGDVARKLRKKPPAQPVIDDDNLTQAMQLAESRRGFGSSLRLLMAGDASGFRVSAPDVTCNLSFSGSAKFLLSNQYSEMELPESDLDRLEAHARIDGDVLNVSVHNGTDWHVSEIAVAFTVLGDKGRVSAATAQGDSPPKSDESAGSVLDKKPDTTVIYRMRAVGVPWSVTTFASRVKSPETGSANWHWAIVGARGYPPESYRRGVTSQPTAENGEEIEPSQSAGSAPGQTPEITPVSNSGTDKPQLVPADTPQ